jgi:O-antigen/teichoic acid export membrane protein
MFALDNSAARWYYDTNDEFEKKKTIASWFWFYLAFATLITVLIFILAPVLSSSFLEPHDSVFFTVSSLNVLTGILPILTQNLLRMQRKATKMVIFSLSYSLLTIGLTILFVLYLKSGVIGVFYAVLCSNVIISICSLFLLGSWISLSFFSMQRLKEMLVFAAPLIPTAIAFWVINSSSTFVLEYFFDLTEVGIFQLGITISSLVVLFSGSFQMAWGPFAYSIIEQDNSKEVYSTVLTAYTILINIISLFVGLFAKEILMLFTTPKYYDASLVSGLLAFNATIYSYVYIVGIGNGIVKDNKPLAIAVLISAFITILLLFTLTPIFGRTGTAISMIAGSVIIPIYVFVSAQKRYFIPYHTKMVLTISILSFGIYLLSIYFQFQLQIDSFFLKCCLFFVFIITCIFLLHFWEKKSLKGLWLMIRKRYK